MAMSELKPKLEINKEMNISDRCQANRSANVQKIGFIIKSKHGSMLYRSPVNQ